MVNKLLLQWMLRWLLQHKLLAASLLVCVIGLALYGGQSVAQAAHPLAPYTPDSGLVYNGLEVDETVCEHGYRIEGTTLCTHGPDPASQPYDAQQSVRTLSARELWRSSATRQSIVCDGDGKSGRRVQVLYARAEDQPDRYYSYLDSIRTWAAEMDEIFNASAQETGGHRHLRFVTNAECQVDVLNVVVPASSDDSIGATVSALRGLGYNSPERKYLVFMDANVYCGIGTIANDSQPGAENLNNNRTGYARIDNGCWSGTAAAHELVHTLGGVQHDAPNASGGWHCVDEYDLVCYSDAPYEPALKFVCQEMDYSNLLDCNHDDYFHTYPPPGSYLATHWNVANSGFLMAPEDADQLPPEVFISTPSEITVFSAPATITINADAVDVDDPILKVEFYNGDTLLTTDTTRPYQYLWMGVASGTYVISAIAYDLFEADTTSNIMEITVVDALVNAAQGKTTMQSSTNENSEAMRAVDGNTNGADVDSSTSRTKREAQPWWQVDLGEVLAITNVRVWGQSDCCTEETDGYYVLVSSDPITAETLADARLLPGVISYYVAALSESVTEIAMHAGQQGRYVRIWTPDTTELALAEVEVISEMETQSAVFLPLIMR